jgi:hypothetical protein
VGGMAAALPPVIMPIESIARTVGIALPFIIFTF